MTRKENRRKLIAGSATLVLLLSLFVFVSSALAGVQKLTLCHVPPGNPDNPQTITVGEPGYHAHLRQHDLDYGGECSDEPPPD